MIGTVIQILLFTLIPFIWWLITARKKKNFFSWIGLKKPVGDKKQITVTEGIALLIYPMIPAILIAFINEKKCEGSILPGWLIHGTLNVITHLTQLW